MSKVAETWENKDTKWTISVKRIHTPFSKGSKLEPNFYFYQLCITCEIINELTNLRSQPSLLTPRQLLWLEDCQEMKPPNWGFHFLHSCSDVAESTMQSASKHFGLLWHFRILRFFGFFGIPFLTGHNLVLGTLFGLLLLHSKRQCNCQELPRQ